MAKRLLRDTTDSEKVNSLSWQSEVFFYRLMMKADDYGSFYANPKMLRAMLFPLKSDSVREADVTRWMAECHKAGLIILYESQSKSYLRILNFGQRLQNMRNKFPEPPRGITVNHGESPPEVEVEVESEVELEGEAFRDKSSLFMNLEKFEKEIKNSFSQIEAAARRNKVSPEKILSMIPDFIDTCRVKGKEQETWREYCNYFSNWLLTEFSKQKTHGNRQTTFIKKGAANTDAELKDALQRHLNQ